MHAGYRLREATLLFQQGDATAAQRMMAGIVRKNGNYSEAHAALAAVEWARVSAGRQAAQAGACLTPVFERRVCAADSSGGSIAAPARRH